MNDGMETGKCRDHGTFYTLAGMGCPGCRTVAPDTLHGLNSPLHPVPDSLEVALRHAPLSCGIPGDAPDIWHGDDCKQDYPALAAAAREWMRQQLPPPEGTQGPGYNRAVADVARRLGLST